jgi:uncharacterized protein (TIGR03437 family)
VPEKKFSMKMSLIQRLRSKVSWQNRIKWTLTMCQNNTLGKALLIALLAGGVMRGQTAAGTGLGLRLDWRRIGNSSVELWLASPATGPVDRVWFSADGSRLSVRTSSYRLFETNDLEGWRADSGPEPPAQPSSSLAVAPPGFTGVARTAPQNPLRVYAIGRSLYRSDDGGLTWTDLVSYKGRTIIGGGIHDLAVSPRDADEIVVANDFGVWRSADGGLSWSGLNRSLPNLQIRRILSVPNGTRGVRVLLNLGSAEWAPGDKHAWRPLADPQDASQETARLAASAALGAPITAVAGAGDFVYAGASDGRVWVSTDQGRNWQQSEMPQTGPVESLYVDAQDPRLAIAALGNRAPGPDTARSPHVIRTTNSGAFWENLTANLPDATVHAVAVDRASSALYAATDQGLFMTRANPVSASPVNWTALTAGLPEVPVRDVKLDASGNQLYIAVDGYGVYAARAPHWLADLRVVNAADYSLRPAAPGSLLSVLGGRIREARAGGFNAPVLAASESESQIQVPFEVTGPALSLALNASAGQFTIGLPLRDVSPAIFVDQDGSPLLLDADSGVLLDARNPARSNSRIQILASGLGKVRPEWPTGFGAPLDNPPQVVAPVSVYLDRTSLEVTRATLAPGYIGFYLVEVQLPEIVNAGPAELHVEAEGQQSNRVRVYLEP